MRDKPSAVHLNSVKGDIKFHDVTFRYVAGMPPTVDGVNLHIRAGETIAKLLLRLYHPQSGIELNISSTIGAESVNSLTRFTFLAQAWYHEFWFSWLSKLHDYLLRWLSINFPFRTYSSGQP